MTVSPSAATPATQLLIQSWTPATRALWQETLGFLLTHAKGKKITLAHSLAVEDVVLTECLAQAQLLADTTVFTLDTGRLHGETLALIPRLETHYGIRIQRYQPEPQAVLHYVKTHGENAFYDSLDLRKACCHLRKSEPLKRALASFEVWLTGQRRTQSITRSALAVFEHDPAHGLDKLNPLANWSDAALWEVVKTLALPYNALHDQGYPSIGCAPCTRAIEAGEEIRAGRWWWEQAEQKECGLHVVDGKLVRQAK